MEADAVKTVRSEWSRTLLVCAKCSKKVGGGFGAKGKQELGNVLRKTLGLKSGRKAAMGIVEVKCLKVCPKGAVTVVDSRDPHVWKVVAAGAPIDQVVAELDLDRSASVQDEPLMVGV